MTMFKLSRTIYNEAILKSFFKMSNMVQFRKMSADLNRAVNEAEKVVGYPTSFLNLRFLLNDELANIALHFRKLIGTDHPLIAIARKMFIGNTLPTWGLVILLLSKAYGIRTNVLHNEEAVTSGVLHSQRSLAEIIEMLRISNLIHKCIINLDKNSLEELNFGNKISLLTGDYLLSKCLSKIGLMNNQDILELVAAALRDLATANFFETIENEEIPIPSQPSTTLKEIVIVDIFDSTTYDVNEVIGHPKAEWILRNILGGASLLGKACQGALNLAGHSEEQQRLGYVFGKSVALAWQAKIERDHFDLGNCGSFSLVGAPVMLHLEKDIKLYDKINVGKADTSKIDYNEIRRIVLSGNALARTKQLQFEYLQVALDVLSKVPYSDARKALENIICKMN